MERRGPPADEDEASLDINNIEYDPVVSALGAVTGNEILSIAPGASSPTEIESVVVEKPDVRKIFAYRLSAVVTPKFLKLIPTVKFEPALTEAGALLEIGPTNPGTPTVCRVLKVWLTLETIWLFATMAACPYRPIESVYADDVESIR